MRKLIIYIVKYIVRVNKQNMMRWAGHIALMVAEKLVQTSDL
jgi:hypothetical protein